MTAEFVPWIVCLILGSFITAAAFVGRMVYVETRRKWTKSVETPEVPAKFRMRTESLHARPNAEDIQPPPPRVPQGTARVRPIRRVR